MEAKRMCQYCYRWFPNGKSLGGHMKSHLSLTYARGSSAAGTSTKPKKKRRAPPPSTGGDFKCKECGKGFQSLRAYWGHMRWHQLVQNDSNRNINIDENSREDAKMTHAAHMLVALSRTECFCYDFPHVNSEEKLPHVCLVCRKIFSTGQALGGHMRAHMPPVPQGTSKTRAFEEQPELGIDLNVEPSEFTGENETSDEVAVSEDDDDDEDASF
ncbi:hypothetical protein LUZ63_014380 [Rhynchospora breviuscula]|uniref:C2H2-type domain-containing protein n=1 Tax=Rhynchospora breviuscula TaxID=2022672 RepID=A0A9Q0HLU6_9POAL|nr:hypothetical protein LUZ63_014380 [Rhynchospora breviuscula]